MAAAIGAQNFRAMHPQAVVLALDHRAFCREIGKARPAAAGIKLVVEVNSTAPQAAQR